MQGQPQHIEDQPSGLVSVCSRCERKLTAFRRVAPGRYRNDVRDIEIERQQRVLGGGRDVTEWVATGAAVNGERTWLTTRPTLREAQKDVTA